MQFKHRKMTITVKSGDYLMDNESCIQFLTGDNRTLIWQKHDRITSVVMSKRAVAELREQVGGFNFIKTGSVYIHKF